MLWERVQAPWAQGGVLLGAGLGYRRAPVFVPVFQGLQRPFLPSTGKSLEASTEVGDFKAEQVEGWKD